MSLFICGMSSAVEECVTGDETDLIREVSGGADPVITTSSGGGESSSLFDLCPAYCDPDPDIYARVSDHIGLRFDNEDEGGLVAKLRIAPGNEEYEHHIVKLPVTDTQHVLPFSKNKDKVNPEDMALHDTIQGLASRTFVGSYDENSGKFVVQRKFKSKTTKNFDPSNPYASAIREKLKTYARMDDMTSPTCRHAFETYGCYGFGDSDGSILFNLPEDASKFQNKGFRYSCRQLKALDNDFRKNCVRRKRRPDEREDESSDEEEFETNEVEPSEQFLVERAKAITDIRDERKRKRASEEYEKQQLERMRQYREQCGEPSSKRPRIDPDDHGDHPDTASDALEEYIDHMESMLSVNMVRSISSKDQADEFDAQLASSAKALGKAYNKK